jgi:hypothetical protein
MKSQTKMAIKVFGGAAAVAVAIGLGGVGVNGTGSNPTTEHPSSSVIPATAASGSSTGSGSGVHSATLADFYAPRTCVVQHRSANTGQVWYTPEPCPPITQTGV